MKHITPVVVALVALWTGAVKAQTIIFNQNFDGGYSGSFSLGHYSGGSPNNTSIQQLSSGGNPNGCCQETMTTTTSGDFYAGQVQLTSVSGNTDINPNNYVLSFDAKGNRAGNIQFIIQTWPNNGFGGTGPVINSTVNDQLSAANTWQTFSVNLGTVTAQNASGATWQLAFQIAASQWGGAGLTDTLTIDNIVLTHISTNSPQIASSANPSAYGAGVTFTATVVTNGVTASNAIGTVVFSFNGAPFSTQPVNNGQAVSDAIANLPIGSNSITAAYSGGNYPASTNTTTQTVNPPAVGIASADLPLYTDELVNGFQNWSWATINLQNSSPVHSGAYSIAVTDGGNQGLAFMRQRSNGEFNDSPYTSFSFWANGGSSGGQVVQVYGTLDYTNQTVVSVAALPANTWQQITIPLSSLGVANKPNVTGFTIQGRSGGSQPTFYVDDVQLTAAAAPAMVHLGANAGQTLRPVDARQFGVNTATWDGNLGAAQTLSLIQQTGIRALRWPGGSTSDTYHWASDPSGNATFRTLAANLSAQVFTTVNYGSGTAAEAAAWVLSANKTNNCGFKYWEIGNECYGNWENDTHAIPQDPYTYATNAAAYIQQMKAAFPSVPIKVGIVVVPGEDSFSNNATHVVVNPRTGTSHGGWTPVVLSTLKSLGVTPDFIIYHFYWQYTPAGQSYYAGSPDSDPLLLQVAGNPSPLNWSDWASAAASLRQQLTDYMGTGTSNVELCVTENNSDAGTMGRQSTSVVNALYMADSTCQLMETEFRSYIWWDLHNGPMNGDFDQTIYGWQPNGDYGILSGSNTPYPAFYAEKLLQSFARPGDSVLASTSDNLLLSAYAVRRTNGALTMLVINKDMVTNLVGQIALSNFVPWSTATMQSWGLPQDNAAQTNGPAALRDVATNSYPTAAASFSYNFPPMSLTLFTFAPGPALLSVQSYQPNQVTLLLQGQASTPYIIQSSPNLPGHWTSVSTNTLAGSSTNIALTILPGQPTQFYRAIWQQ
jgi:hypothetical protein